MRLVLLAATAAAFALPAAAQPALPDSADAYVSPILGFGYGGQQGSTFLVGGEVGRRLPSGVDVGLRAYGGNVTFGSTSPLATVGPTVGYTRHLPGGIEADARVLGTLTFADLDGLGGSDGFGLRALNGAAQATLGRPFRVVGSLQLAPTVGGFASVCTALGVETASDAGCASAGIVGGVDVRFRAFGAEVSVPVVGAYTLTGNTRAGQLGAFQVVQTPITAGVRIRF